MAFSFEKLHVHKSTIEFADSVGQEMEGFSRGHGFLVDQLNRAALSIAANITEGNGRFNKPDRGNFLGIARGYLEECAPLLELARRRGLITDECRAELKDRLEEIPKSYRAD